MVFDGYRKGGCHSGRGEAPENVSKNEVFYRANRTLYGASPVTEGPGSLEKIFE
jgi:hypothetical protein